MWLGQRSGRLGASAQATRQSDWMIRQRVEAIQENVFDFGWAHDRAPVDLLLPQQPLLALLMDPAKNTVLPLLYLSK
eukprot:3500573-Prymnesium_polylepis.1